MLVVLDQVPPYRKFDGTVKTARAGPKQLTPTVFGSSLSGVPSWLRDRPTAWHPNAHSQNEGSFPQKLPIGISEELLEVYISSSRSKPWP